MLDTKKKKIRKEKKAGRKKKEGVPYCKWLVQTESKLGRKQTGWKAELRNPRGDPEAPWVDF